ncbi:MAG: hypothetical protein IT326_09795 [Anaerolineae bacterium]|nr:hypothetical protein [Anaerolineae bacterium]
MSETLPEDTISAAVPSRRGIWITLGALLALMALAAGFGALSSVVGQGRHNEEILPRALDVYAIYPDGHLRVVRLVHPVDMQLVDKKIEPHDEEVVLFGPSMARRDDLVDVDHAGARLTRSEAIVDPHNPGWFVERFPLVRRTGDGPYWIDLALASSPNLSQDGVDWAFSLEVRPQETFAQQIIAITVPHTSEALDNGFESYRDVYVGGWRVFFYDTSVLAAEDTIRLDFTMPADTRRPVDFNISHVENRR